MKLNVPSTSISEFTLENLWPLTGVRIREVLQKSGDRIVGALSANEGEFVFKVADPSKTEEKIKLDTFVFEFLRKKKFQHIPILLKTRSGKDYERVGDKFVYVMERIPGKSPKGNPENWKQIGEITAKLHIIRGYPHNSLFTVESEIPKMVKKSKNLLFAEEYMALVDGLPDLSSLSHSIIHTDIGLHNTVQRADGHIVFVDWDDVGMGTTILDLGFTLSQFVTEDLEFEDDMAQAFYQAYFSHRDLPEEEKPLIFDAALFFSLMYLPVEKNEKQWQRIKFAVKNKTLLLSVLK